jgi:hypothetical protein
MLKPPSALLLQKLMSAAEVVGVKHGLSAAPPAAPCLLCAAAAS